jgi:hypothetical protein
MVRASRPVGGRSPYDERVRDIKQPKIDISSYATPVASNPSLVAVAVTNVEPEEAEAIKSFADQVRARRGNAGEQSVTISWWGRSETVLVNDPARTSQARIINGLDPRRPMPVGWTKFMNNAANRVEWVSPDDQRYVESIDGRSLIPVAATCNKGHDLPPGQSWCQICERTSGRRSQRPNDLQSGEVWMCSNGHWVEGEYATCPECKKKEAEPKVVDRFSGLEL